MPLKYFALLAITATAASCSRRVASPEPTPAIGAAPLSSVDTTQPGARDAFRRADEAAAQVDTIVVQPDSLVLRVGEAVQPWTALRIEARSRDGERVANFAPFIRVEDTTIVEQGPDGLIARRVGRTMLVIRPMSIDPAVRVRDVRAAVVVNVVP
jgi:hypothetical protein